ncbi:hypothetical protein EV121DRAFT_284610 [Schizophyllum commune]
MTVLAIVDATSTTPDSPPSAGEFTIFQRVYGIPLVAAALDKLHETLSTNVLTARPYAAAQGLAVVAYQCWQPVLKPLAPLIARVDVLANTILDLAETRFPYLLDATPEDMMDVLHDTRATFVNDARTRLDEGIKRPALHLAEGIDERLAPFLDYYEDHIEPLGDKSARSTRPNEHIEVHETQYQYQRALSLLKALIERIASLPSDQWQQTSFLLQRSVIQVQELSDAMLAQLHALQHTVSALATSMQRSVTAAQKQLTITLVEAANALSATIADLKTTLTSEELTTGARIDRVADLATSRINPLLERSDACSGDELVAHSEDKPGSFGVRKSNAYCEDPTQCSEDGPGEYLEVDVSPYREEGEWAQEAVVDLTLGSSLTPLVYNAGGYSGSFVFPARALGLQQLQLGDGILKCIVSPIQASTHSFSACERKHIASSLRLSSTGNALHHGRILQEWSLPALAQASTSSQDRDCAEPASWTLPPGRGEGKTISIARDPATRKFPCPCGAPKHARREADKIRALCKDYNPHPGPDAEKALEVDTDDENANPAPGGPTRRTKRRARRSPSSDRAPRQGRRAGKRRATGPRPDDDSDDDEPIIVEGPSKVHSGGPVTRTLGGSTNISAYGGIEHATGSRSAMRKPFESSRAQDDLERQVESLAALNLAARREYIEVMCATAVRRHPSLTRYSVSRRAKLGLASSRRAHQGADAPRTADER